MPSLPSSLSGRPPPPGVQQVVEPLADQAEAERHDHDDQPRERDEPPEPGLEEPLAVEREPTNCEFTFNVQLPERERYRLVLDEGDPFPFSLDDLEANEARLRFTIP